MEISPVTAKNSPTRRVLVVDDEALIRWSLVELFTDVGYEVREASDGASALSEAAEGEAFDVIVLDYRLPDSNDLCLLEQIRQLQPQAAVVMMTAFGTPEMVSGALELGAYRVVSKPFDVHDMVNLVAQAHGFNPREN
jgi:DNA-binding NtrC family response regulator